LFPESGFGEASFSFLFLLLFLLFPLVLCVCVRSGGERERGFGERVFDDHENAEVGVVVVAFIVIIASFGRKEEDFFGDERVARRSSKVGKWTRVREEGLSEVSVGDDDDLERGREV